VLEREEVMGAVRLSIHLVDDATIAALNAKHRGLDRPTDVLSFALLERGEQDRFVLPPAERLELGDIVISYPRVLAQAEEFGHSRERELGFLTAHGLLHILGHDHEESEERVRMRDREEAVLTAVGLSR
jgi:probable rRNA maturation factor